MEIWKPIKGYEGLYDISTEGRVYSHITKKFLSPSKIKNHYRAVALYKNKEGVSKTIHTLVAKAFIPRENLQLQVNHIDGNKHNNNVLNLEWVTAKGNSEHAIRTGLFDIKGEKQWGSKLKKVDVLDILSRYGFEKVQDIARDYNVAESTITLIAKGKNWKHLVAHIVAERKFRWKNIEKPCTKCKQIQPLSNFYKDTRNRDGLKSWCKRCFGESIANRRSKIKSMTDEVIRANIERK